LDNPVKKEIAMQLVSSAENSSLDWKAQYGYIEWNVEGVADENRGYTAGIIGFCSGCGDMTPLVQYYTQLQPGNVLSKYVPALQEQERLGMGNVTQVGLGSAFEADWKTAAKDQKFLQAQDYERDRSYFTPAVNHAKADGLGALGQFIYYDAMVVHGPGEDSMSFGGIRTAAIRNAKPPAQGGNEVAYLNAFLDARVKVMQAEEAHSDVSRIEDAQRVFLRAGNLGLNPPLNWKVYGDEYSIKSYPVL
jgi:chitosanase